VRILFLSRWFPYPPDNGSRLRVYNLLRGLAQHHDVTLLSFVEDPREAENAAGLQSLCGEIKTVVRKPFQPYSPRAVAALFSMAPRSVVDTFSPEMDRSVRKIVAETAYDLVIASQEGTAVYGSCLEGVPALFEEVEVGVPYGRYVAASSGWTRFRRGLTWIKQKRHLGRMLRHFGACTVVSGLEEEMLRRAVPDAPPVSLIPNCVSLQDYAETDASPRAGRLIFTGSFRYQPNHEAMAWFLRDVYPAVLQQETGVELIITGDHADLPLPPSPAVILTGHVSDVRSLIGSAWASLAPIHSGGGTRLKILEAMAMGTPVIATSKGAEGLEVESGRHLLLADTPSEFAGATVRLLRDPKLRERLAKSALELVSARYDWPAVMPRFLRLVDRVAASGGGRAA
jgi:polysaccharide biosynthesis protein PslH